MGESDREYSLVIKDQRFFNSTCLFLGLLGSSTSAQSGPTEERGSRERATRSQHQDRHTDGKGCTGILAFHLLIHLDLLD